MGTDAKPYTPEQCNDACKDKYPYFTIASGDKNCKCHPSCPPAGHGHTAYASSYKKMREYPWAKGGCKDVAGGSGWLTLAKPYTPKQCNDACKDAYPYFTIASGDKNCKCHPSCTSAHHGHTAYTSSYKEFEEYPAAEGGCKDVTGGSGWLSTNMPYTPEQCNDACKDAFPYFTIASEDKNCKCHPSCSSAGEGHTAYKSYIYKKMKEYPA